MDLRYPIGRPEIPEEITMSHIQQWIDDAEAVPEKLRVIVGGLTQDQLDTPYRPEGWTVRQVVHHLADSHLSTYTAFKFGLSEDDPMLKPANVNVWAETVDAKTGDVELALRMFEGIQGRWVELMKGMTEEDFRRTVRFPERDPRSLATMLAVYSWHGKHHLAHITGLCDRMGW